MDWKLNCGKICLVFQESDLACYITTEATRCPFGWVWYLNCKKRVRTRFIPRTIPYFSTDLLGALWEIPAARAGGTIHILRKHIWFQGMYWCAHKTATLTSIQYTVPLHKDIICIKNKKKLPCLFITPIPLLKCLRNIWVVPALQTWWPTSTTRPKTFTAFMALLLLLQHVWPSRNLLRCVCIYYNTITANHENGWCTVIQKLRSNHLFTSWMAYRGCVPAAPE